MIGRRAMPPHHDETAGLIAALLGLVLLIITGSIAALWLIPESANPTVIVTVLLAAFSTSVPQLVTAIVAGRTSKKVDRVINGEMEAKVRRVIREELPDATPPSTDS